MNGMKRNPRTAEHIKAALAALHSPPMTDEESREFRRLITREMARAEARRRQSRQMDFEVSAK